MVPRRRPFTHQGKHTQLLRQTHAAFRESSPRFLSILIPPAMPYEKLSWIPSMLRGITLGMPKMSL